MGLEIRRELTIAGNVESKPWCMRLDASRKLLVVELVPPLLHFKNINARVSPWLAPKQKTLRSGSTEEFTMADGVSFHRDSVFYLPLTWICVRLGLK